jgi:hypothetical protein
MSTTKTLHHSTRLPALAAILLTLAAALHGQTARVVGQIDESRRIELRGNTPSRARPEYDRGLVHPSLVLDPVTLHMKPSPQQQQALDQLLAEQQDPSSQNYHRWLTPEEFGDRFGLSRGDMDSIRAWLESKGLRVGREARGRNWIDFSGTAEQVSRTFRTEIHRYEVDGEAHFANATNPSIPAALAGVISGVSGLDDFRPRAPVRRPRLPGFVEPQYTNLFGTHYLAPDDIATIYDLKRLYDAGIDGTGQKIVIVGKTAIDPSYAAAFRSIFNLSSNPLQLHNYGSGAVGSSSEVAEAFLDVEWAGAVARNATIIYAYSDDVFDAVRYAINDNLAPVISSSYTYADCDRKLPASFLDSLRRSVQQANAQGMTWLNASGDTGAAGCDPNPSPAPAVGGYGVAAPASVPEVTAVGGTEFVEGNGNYWNYFNGNNQGSAVSYIPEKAWNDTGSWLEAGGGGTSGYYPAPWWQTGPGFPSTGFRNLPDVSLAASGSHDGFVICTPTSPCPYATWKILGGPPLGLGFNVTGGTSAATPVFAGILALLNHYLVSHGGQAGLGNVNPTLYWLFQNSPSAFHDIMSGDNIVPCQIGSTSDCLNGFLGFNAASGYDRATGLGSVKGYDLVTAWAALPVPLVQSISPISPTAGSGNQTVSVNGIGFQSGLRVVATFPNGSSTMLQGSGQIQGVISTNFQMVITLGAAGPWSIQVIDADGRPSNIFPFSVNPAVQVPSVSTTSASGVTNNSAVLGGLVNPNGADTHVWFQYSTNSSMSGSVATPQQYIGSGTITVPFSANLSSLAGNTTYYYQAWASNSAGLSHGVVASFTTATSVHAPTVSTSSASFVTSNGATLGGSVNPNGLDTHVWFQYSTNSSLTGSVATLQQDIGSGTTTVPFSANLSGLAGNTTYYFQAWASNSAGTSQGVITSFATAASAQAPAVSTSGASSVTSISVTLGGSVNANGLDTHVWFQYSTSSSMSGSVASPQQDVGSGISAVPFSANLSGLAPGTTYYFQAWGSNNVGASQGSVLSFATSVSQTLAPPANLAPGDTSTNVSVNPTLTWSPVLNATGYTIFFGITNPPSFAVTNGGFSATSYVPGQLSGNTTYYWRVVATNAVASTSSPTISFTTLTPAVTGPVLVSGLTNPTALALDTDTLYWTEFGGLIRKASKAGGAPITLFASQFNPTGIAVDNGTVYFGDGVNLRSVPKGGGSSTILTAATPSQIALDATNIYWTDAISGTGAIRKMPRTGGSPVTLATGTTSPSGIKTDGVNVYWSEFSSPGMVWKVSVNGGTPSVLGTQVNNRGIAIDPTSTNVYWGENVFVNAGRIDFAPANGGPPTNLVTGLNNVWDVAADGTSVFWVEDRTGGVVRQVALSGGSPATLANNLAEPVALALDPSNVYWIERNGGGAATGTLKTLPKVPTGLVTIGTNPSGLSFQVDGVAYSTQQTFIWLQGSSHSVTTTANQSQVSGTQFVWRSWTDGGSQSHSIIASFNASYTATFATQYFLTTSATQFGTISPASGWYDAGTIVSIAATASSGDSFVGFSGNLSGTMTPQSVVMNGPITVSANFSAPTDFGISVSPSSQGVTRGSPATFIVSTSVMGSAQAVSLGVTGLPSGATFAFNPTSVTSGGSSTLTINTTSTTPTGTFTLTITGTGSATHSTPVSLTVCSGPFCGFSSFANAQGVQAQVHDLGVDSNGSVYLLVPAGASLAVYKSTNGGNSFGSPVSIPNSAFSNSEYQLFVDPANTIHVVWWLSSSSSTDVYYSRSTNGGASFSSPIPVRSGAFYNGYRIDNAIEPVVTADGSGNVYVAYSAHTLNSGGSFVGYNIWVSKSTNGGVSFQPEFYVFTPDSNQKRAERISATSTGFYILYLDETNSNIYVHRGSSSTVLNNASMVNSNSGKVGGGGGLAVDPNGGTVYVVYSDTTSDAEGDIRFCKSTDSGSTWGNCTTVNDNTYRGQDSPSIVRDGSGALHAIWTDLRSNSKYQIYYAYSTDGGSSFSTPNNNLSADQPGSNFNQGHVVVDGPRSLLYVSASKDYTQLVVSHGSFASGAPALAITKTHNGSFSQSQTGATHTVTVRNGASAGPSSGTVTVTENVPLGLTLVSMSGIGWSCPLNTCTRNDALSRGTAYPDITVTVNVAANAPSQVTNSVTVSGGGSASVSANDVTTIVALPVLAITGPAALAAGTVSLVYPATTITATGGTGSYTYSATGLPTGLSLDTSTGVLSGTPTTATGSPFSVSITVIDSASRTATRGYSLTVNPIPPVLSIVETHTGNFTQGQNGATYTVTVSNQTGTGSTSGTVTVTETVPSDMTLVSMSGTGWTCPGTTANNCTRGDALPGGSSYPAITLMANVAANATSPQVNQVSVSGGGSATASASDPTTIVSAGQPSLKIVASHAGNFFQGQQGATYTLLVSNNSGVATTGTVTVTELLPSGLSLFSMSGAGWGCVSTVCTRGDLLAAGGSYPVITVTVNVSGTATSPQVNQVSVSGGGSASANTSDSTIVGLIQPTLSVNRKVLNFGVNGALVASPQTVLVTITGGVNVAWTATSDHSNITANPGAGVGTGTFQISATQGSSGIVTVNAAGAANSPQTIQVNVAGVTPTAPFGSFDTPAAGSSGVVGAIPVTGWALDNVEVTRVDILREPVVGEPSGNLILIGSAVFVADARPDVQGMFPSYPFSYRAGWGYQMLTNFLPNASGSGAPGNGTYKLHAIAFNKVGNQLDLGTKTITVDNAHTSKPFGTIDTPAQGGTISGTDSVNFGWALSPQPSMIPIDGSTITVVIDGVPIGHPTYNQFRSDIANLFAGYANSGGAVGFFHINTTTLANGVHTISWNVFDNLGRGEGLGSRYFNVLNTSGGPVAAPEDVIPETAARGGVRISHGLDVNRRLRPISPDPDGGYSVTMEEVGHIEMHLGAARGNMLVLGEAQALPTGSTLKGGVFSWQPGPGFLGKYTMQFERPDGSRIPVRVNIVPKRYE